MRPLRVLLASGTLACGSSSGGPTQSPDPEAGPSNAAAGCYNVRPGERPSSDVSLPTFIELSLDQAPGFVSPGRLAVHEPRAATPAAPISWWIPRASTQIELVLGGGYTGYAFSLRAGSAATWVGQGTYFADFGVEPTPPPLPLTLTPASCS
jgi:hypothetical protein